MIPSFVAFLLLLNGFTFSYTEPDTPRQESATTLSEPVFSHPAGTFLEPFDLSFEVPEGARLYYTTNGSKPDESATLFNPEHSVTISGSMRIRARLYRDGSPPGPVATRVYSQLHPDVAEFSSDLPVVIVHQFFESMTDMRRTPAFFTVIDREDDGRSYLLTDQFTLQSRMITNYRGSSSLQFPKKQFAVRLVDEDDENRNESLLGMPSENNWIMSAPYDDKTLMRNAIAYQLSRDMGRYAPRTRFVELFLHQWGGPVTMNHYHGVYMLTERIKWDNSRVNITKLGPDDNSEPEITGGYIINYDREQHFWSTSSRNTGFALVRPQDEDITPQQREWIARYIGDLENVLFGLNFRDPDDGYTAWLDPDSFIDHHLITEALKEIDGYRLSTYLHKDRDGRLVMGPVWDFNISLGNGNYLNAWNPIGWYYPQISPRDYLNGWYRRLFEDPDFAEDYRTRWWELRQGPFSTGHILSMIEDYARLLDEAQARNFERWPILGTYVWPNHFVGDTFEEEVTYMADWIEARLNWIDTQMGTPPEQDEPALRYFWYFGDDMPNNTPLLSVDAAFSLSQSARITYHSALEGYPFETGHPRWRKASMERRNQPTSLNYRPDGNFGRPYESRAMRALQVRQPFRGDAGENTLIFEVPTSGLKDIVFRFAAMDEGAAEHLVIDYSTLPAGDEPEPQEWIKEGLESSGRFTLTSQYQLFTLDFSGIRAVSNNPHFRIRIRFDGDDMAADLGNRVTFNNISLDAVVRTGLTDNDRYPDQEEVPSTFTLDQNYPNPFNPSTIIRYYLPDQARVRLSVYNALGKLVDTLVDETQRAGVHEITFDASNLSSGIYFYHLIANDQSTIRKMTLIK